MNRFLKFAILSMAVAALWSCNDDKSYPDTGMTVNPNNISGTWKLTEWSGAQLAEGTFVYMNIKRKDQEITLYQNLDSFTARVITGNYNIYSDDLYGPIIRGEYDNDMGYWSHRYIVRELTKTSMKWIMLDDQSDVQIFTRVDAIPGDILSLSE